VVDSRSGELTRTSPNLSDDWWRSADVCRVLCDWFRRHLVCLYLACDAQGERKHLVYTGFLLRFQGLLLWASAGHVIDEVNAIRQDAAWQVRQMRWLDGCDIPHAESVVVHDRNLMTYSGMGQGIDFGAVAIMGLDAANIVAGGRVVAITEEIWRNLEVARPDGYYLIGYPQPWVSATSRLAGDGSTHWSIRADLSCVPLRRIERPPKGTSGYSGRNKDAFYGQILPFLDGEGYQPDTVSGMSGGPVFSVERDPREGIRYRLFGIQSTWWRESRVVRAESIGRILALIGDGPR
jgi:hypothetical protein